MSEHDVSAEHPKAAAKTAAAFLIRWELLVVALIAPLLAFPPLGRPVIWVALIVPLLWLFELPPLTPLNGSILVLLVAVLLSITASVDLFYAAPKILGVALGVITFFAIVRRVDSEAALTIAVDLYVVAGVALAAAGLLGTKWWGKVPLLAKITDHLPLLIRGLPGAVEGFHPNATAGGLLFFLPVQFASVFAAGTRARRIAGAGAFAVTAAVMLLTQSRNAWISLGVAAAAWTMWQFRGTRRRVAIPVVIVATIVAGAIVLVYRTSVERAIGHGLRSDVSSRAELWSRAIQMIHDFPITGAGMNGFRRLQPVLYPAMLTSPDVDVAHAHNHLLQAALDIGLPGLVAYLAIWLGAAAMIATTLRNARNRRTRRIAGGLGAAFVASFVFGTADVIPLGSKVGIVFWVALALAVALHAQAREEAA